MLLSASALPRGVALVLVRTPVGRVVLVSDRLSDPERFAAMTIACYKMREGAHAVVLRELEIAAVMADAA